MVLQALNKLFSKLTVGNNEIENASEEDPDEKSKQSSGHKILSILIVEN